MRPYLGDGHILGGLISEILLFTQTFFMARGENRAIRPESNLVRLGESSTFVIEE